MVSISPIRQFHPQKIGAQDENPKIRAQKLQKKVTGLPLMNLKDDLMDWKQGPVVPRCHHQLKTCLEDGHHDVVGLSVVESDIYHPKHIEPIDLFLKRVHGLLYQYSPWGLCNMIQEEVPWLHTQNGDIISIDALKKFFGQESIKNKLKG